MFPHTRQKNTARKIATRVKILARSAIFIAMAMSGAASARSVAKADLVLINAKIYTVDPSRSIVQAMAVKDGKILFVGSDKEAARYIGADTQVKDLNHSLVLPGLVDAHIHPLYSIDFNVCDLHSKALGLADLVREVRTCTAKLSLRPGQWISIIHWEYGAGNAPGEGYKDLRDALDGVSKENPVMMSGWDGHHGAYNSVALAMAKNNKGDAVGLNKETLKTDFAAYTNFIGMRSDGEPNGALNDLAQKLVDTSQITEDQQNYVLNHPELVSELLSRNGITAILDAKAFENTYKVYDAMIAAGKMNFWTTIAQFYDIEAFANASGKIQFEKIFEKADAVRNKYTKNPLVSVDFIKFFTDGSVESNPNDVPPSLGNSPLANGYQQPIFERNSDGGLSVRGYVDPASANCGYVRAHPGEYENALVISDFITRFGYHPGQCKIYYGELSHSVANLNQYVLEAHKRDYTMHIHVIGDAGTGAGIDAIENSRKILGKSFPDGLAHIEFATPADVIRMGKNKLFLAFTYSWMYAEPEGYDLSLVPFYNKVSGHGYEAFHKPDSPFEQNYYPVKTAKNAGAVLVAGSDAPVLTNDPQPFVNMQYAMTRAKPGLPPTSPWQRLTIREIIDAYTIDGARSIRREKQIGSLEPGKSADFILVDQDVFSLADENRPEKIGETKVVETWFRGKKVFGR